MMGDVTNAIKVAKDKLGHRGWIRTTTSSQFKDLLARLLTPVKDNWAGIYAGTSIQAQRAPLEPQSESEDAEVRKADELLKTRLPYIDEGWKSVRAAFKTELDKLVFDVLGPEWVVVYEGDYGPHFLRALVKVLLLLVLPLLLLYYYYVSAIEYF